MKNYKLVILVSILFLFNIQLVSGVVLNAEDSIDETDDGILFEPLFNEEQRIPIIMPIDISSITFSLDETALEDYLLVSMSTVTPPLPHLEYSLEIVFDLDSDPSTGISEPYGFYNGLGADLDVGVEVTQGEISSKWIDSYTQGSWSKIGEPDAIIEDAKISVKIPLDYLGPPLESKIRSYLISEGGVDIIPNQNKPPISIELHFEPEAIIQATSDVDEGIQTEFDASSSSSQNGPIILYEWDLDGDGVYDESSSDPIFHHEFPDDGLHQVVLRATDSHGYTSIESIFVNVVNVSPRIQALTITGEPIVDSVIEFNGEAQDIPADSITFEWDFGDGNTAQGKTVTHNYSTSGQYTITLTVTDDEGGKSTESTTTEIESADTPTGGSDQPPGPEIDPWLIILVVLFGVFGYFIYDYFFREKKDGKDDDNGDKDWCEEHPEVVEEEQKKCDEALEALDDALGPIEEKLETYRTTWRDVSREVGRQIGEFDIAYAMVASLTESEAQLYDDASQVQEIAGKVTGFAGSIKTIAKEGVEKATTDFAKDMAKDASKNAAGGMSKFLSDVMSLEEWAMSEIGIGLAKLITGIDPKAEASRIRESSLEIVNKLETWISSSHARNAGIIPPITLHDYIDDAQQLIDDIEAALQAFEDAVAGFRCVECSIDGPYSEHIREMINELNEWMRAFGDMIDQITQRLDQAIAMYGLRDAYDGPYSRVAFQNRQIPDIKKAIENSNTRRQEG